MPNYYLLDDIPKFKTPINNSTGNSLETKNNRMTQFIHYLKNLHDKKETTIDGNKISKIFFPDEPCNVFISHSHADKQNALLLKNICESKQLSAFVDSENWLNVSDLISKICPPPSLNTHELILKLACNAYLMLAAALLKCIAACDIFVFIDTKNSIQRNNDSPITNSPWIMLELATSTFMPTLLTEAEIRAGMENFQQFSFVAPLQNLKKITWSEFNDLLCKRRH